MVIPTPTYNQGLGHGKSVPRRHRRARYEMDAIMGIITKPAIRRLSRRGGIYRIKADIYDYVRFVIKARLKEIIERLVISLGHATAKGPQLAPPKAARKTITTEDIVFVLRRMGTPLYGFEQPYANRTLLPGKT